MEFIRDLIIEEHIGLEKSLVLILFDYLLYIPFGERWQKLKRVRTFASFR